MSYFLKPSLNENDLAIIERGATAAHSIEAGQYVSWHGRTGKAKADILQGATLSESLFDYEEDGTLNALNASLTSNPDTSVPNCWKFPNGVMLQHVVIQVTSSGGSAQNFYVQFPVQFASAPFHISITEYTSSGAANYGNLLFGVSTFDESGVYFRVYNNADTKKPQVMICAIGLWK